MTRAPLLALLLVGTGCADGPYAAPSWASVVVGGDVTLVASEAFEEMDDEGAIATAQVMVIDGRSDVPMSDIEVEVTSSAPGVYVLPEDAVQEVDEPADGSYQDTGSGRSYTFDIGGAHATPTSFVSGTDGRGILGFYLFVDALPIADSGGQGEVDYAAVNIRASIRVHSDSFQVTAE